MVLCPIEVAAGTVCRPIEVAAGTDCWPIELCEERVVLPLSALSGLSFPPSLSLFVTSVFLVSLSLSSSFTLESLRGGELCLRFPLPLAVRVRRW